MKKIYIDVETTGLNPHTDCITELAAIFVDEDDVEGIIVERTFHIYAMPDATFYTVDNIANYVNLCKKLKSNLTLSFLRGQGVGQKTLYNEFKMWLSDLVIKYAKKDKVFFIAYNAKFDVDFIRQLFLRNNDNYYGSFFWSLPLDIPTLVMEAVDLGLLPMPENLKLGTVLKTCGLDSNFESHSGLSDVTATKKLHEYLRRLLVGVTGTIAEPLLNREQNEIIKEN